MNFGNPQNIEHYSELVHCIDGLAAAARLLAMPYVSGNVSLYNESKMGNAIPASPIVACVGGIDDVANVITAQFKRAGSALFLLGRPQNAVGGAVFAELLEQTGGPVPPIDYERAISEIAFFRAAGDAGFILSARSVGNGGLLATLAEMAFPTLEKGRSPIGAIVSPARSWSGAGDLESYFGECGGFVLEAAEDDAEALASIATEHVKLIRHRQNSECAGDSPGKPCVRLARFVRTLEPAARAGVSMKRKVAVLVFPGTNSETETWRVCRDVGLDAEVVHWSRAAQLPAYDAYVLPGGFAYEDRIRAGAVPAHDPMMDYVIEGAQKGKLVLGVCNGAQILLEAGLVPGTGGVRKPTAAFTRNGPVPHFICKHVHIKLAAAPERCAITAALPKDALIPAWAAHGEGRLAATPDRLREIVTGGHLSFVYAHHDGTVDDDAVPNGSALGCAGLTNRGGNVLAIMPHPERDAWNYNHPDSAERTNILAPSGGVALFAAFAEALKRA